MKTFIHWTCKLLIFIILTQPIVVALASEKSDKEALEGMAKDFIHGYKDSGSSNQKQETTVQGDHERYHGEYVDHDGVRHEFSMERQIERVSDHERKFAFNEFGGSDKQTITVHDVPEPRAAELNEISKSPQEAVAPPSAPTLDKQPSLRQDFEHDRQRMDHFLEGLHNAKPEGDKKNCESRTQVDFAAEQLKSAAADGARLSQEWVARTQPFQETIDHQMSEFTPPDLQTLVNIPPGFAPVVLPDHDSYQGRQKFEDHLAEVATADAQISAKTEFEKIWDNGIAVEIKATLSQNFHRIYSFLNAHQEGLRVGGDLVVGLALSGFPVISFGWGLANLVSMATEGKTILGQPVTGKSDYLLVGVGAILPAALAGKAAKEVEVLEDVAKSWKATNFDNAVKSMVYHFDKHAAELETKTMQQYTQDALEFFEKNRSQAQEWPLKDGQTGFKISPRGKGPGGIYTENGKIVTFWYK